MAQTVPVVRKAPGRAPGGYVYVETVPKRGLRMAVAVRRIACDADAMPVAPRTGRALRMTSVLSLGALVGAALAFIPLYRTRAGQ